ncbi:SbtR family transcriptional regulator [Paractinoplanes tereljensis]|uniref:SbtR family transcriptional regulator n=1 Tax=Paractinoplanes tereljensis TaxID=571912 RepID=UPI003399D164
MCTEAIRFPTREALLLASDQAVRPGIAPDDLLMSLGGIALIAAEERQRELASRLLDLLTEGLRGQE